MPVTQRSRRIPCSPGCLRLTGLTARAAQRLIEVNFPHTRFLSSKGSAALVAQLSANGVSGGAVYDALVAAAAAEHGLRLVSRDIRAAGTYRAMGVDLELLP